MLKRGEVDIAYSIRGALAEELRRTPGPHAQAARRSVSPHWLVFAEQWDPKSPWHDRRVRLAANLAIDRQAINQAETLGFSRITGSIIPHELRVLLAAAALSATIRRKAKQLLAEAGYPERLRRRRLCVRRRLRATMAEAVVNYLQAVGIRARLRPLERAAFFKALPGEEAQEPASTAVSGAFGNAATRLEAFVVTGGAVRLRQLSRHRRALPRAGRRARPQAARGAPAPDPAAHARARRCSRPIWELGFINGAGPAGGGVGPRPHRRLRVLGALRGPEAQEPMTRAQALKVHST